MNRRNFVQAGLGAMGMLAGSQVRAQASGPKVTLRMQSVDAASTMEFKDLAQAFAQRARELSGGRLDIQVHPAGALMKSNEVPDAVSKGALDMANTFLVYMSGKEPALKAANEWPAMVEPLQGVAWVYTGGGLALMREITAGRGIFWLGASPLSGEHIWSRKPLKSVADLKGLKIRASALAADSFKKLGAAVVSMPGEELYQALQRGIVDAIEFTTLSVNYGFGFHEVTKHLVFPTYSGGGTYDWIINKKKWESIPADLQRVLEAALGDVSFHYWLKSMTEERRLLSELKKKGMQYIEWSAADMRTLEDSRISIMREVYAKDSALYAKKLESQMKYLSHLGYKHA